MYLAASGCQPDPEIAFAFSFPSEQPGEEVGIHLFGSDASLLAVRTVGGSCSKVFAELFEPGSRKASGAIRIPTASCAPIAGVDAQSVDGGWAISIAQGDAVFETLGTQMVTLLSTSGKVEEVLHARRGPLQQPAVFIESGEAVQAVAGTISDDQCVLKGWALAPPLQRWAPVPGFSSDLELACRVQVIENNRSLFAIGLGSATEAVVAGAKRPWPARAFGPSPARSETALAAFDRCVVGVSAEVNPEHANRLIARLSCEPGDHGTVVRSLASAEQAMLRNPKLACSDRGICVAAFDVILAGVKTTACTAFRAQSQGLSDAMDLQLSQCPPGGNRPVGVAWSAGRLWVVGDVFDTGARAYQPILSSLLDEDLARQRPFDGDQWNIR